MRTDSILRSIRYILANAVHCRRAGETTICACVHCVVAWVSKVAGEGEVGNRINDRMRLSLVDASLQVF